jgi:hypothetical protein
LELPGGFLASESLGLVLTPAPSALVQAVHLNGTGHNC